MGRFEGRAPQPQRERAPQPDQAALLAELKQVQEQIAELSTDPTNNADALSEAQARERVLQNKLNGDSAFGGDASIANGELEG